MLVMRSCPYWNECIIIAIQDVYFSGGHMSFASQFGSLFLSCDHCDNETRHEVPIPMVALVATVVSFYPIIKQYSNLNL